MFHLVLQLYNFFFQDAQNEPKIYVQTILEVHRKFDSLVIRAFKKEKGFVGSLDKETVLKFLVWYRLWVKKYLENLIYLGF